MASTIEEFRAAGWNYSIAEALHENDHTVESAKLLSTDEVFELFLEWNGIIGFSGVIRDALDNCRNMEAV
jgi:hypothetical protein